MMNRRDVLTVAASVGAACAWLPAPAQTGDEVTSPFPVIDTNVSLFRWPFRRLPLDETDALLKKFRSLGIVQACAGSFDGILHRDITKVNQQLADACRHHPELIPFGSINPELPGWEEDLRQCIEVHDMRGIRLHPNYHGYTLEDPRFIRLLELATEAGRLIQIAVSMEDPRTQHSLLQVPEVDLASLPKRMTAIPGAKVQILNLNARAPLMEQLSDTPGVYFDTARVEGTDGVPKLVQSVPPGRVMFGSHSPFLIPEAALIRVHESAILDDASLRAVLYENARRAHL